jgi:hypothetical protein
MIIVRLGARDQHVGLGRVRVEGERAPRPARGLGEVAARVRGLSDREREGRVVRIGLERARARLRRQAPGRLRTRAVSHALSASPGSRAAAGCAGRAAGSAATAGAAGSNDLGASAAGCAGAGAAGATAKVACAAAGAGARPCRQRATRGPNAKAIAAATATDVANQRRVCTVCRRARPRAASCATRTAASDARTSSESASRGDTTGASSTAAAGTSVCSIIRRLSYRSRAIAKNHRIFARAGSTVGFGVTSDGAPEP